MLVRFQSTLPVWGATSTNVQSPSGNNISIHAPRVGSDRLFYVLSTCSAISIHAPRVGSDGRFGGQLTDTILFQSTLPVWGATASCDRLRANITKFQSTLPVWGATFYKGVFLMSTAFQSTLPVWGATPNVVSGELRPSSFQSTLPVWGATVFSTRNILVDVISIHAPRVGSDPASNLNKVFGYQISIHAPRVGSDLRLAVVTQMYYISIHAPRVGSDLRSPGTWRQPVYFNPRSPCGERPARV